ncbi:MULTISPECIES: amylo-alpha-1,6-glucosidase [unclassified Bacillus (in: firmicutes)]|uniref:amylo-alpha-1,6-glucosidase n=1 Tax=unclassified Bacillus (in: firmicutes) TaxID=185979 RepID=UPI0008EFA662|nr:MULTISPECIES: amylo-alpha-1,6-glucosidase [unclassified Bacillus (in: firmicutes)]SFB23371.1 Glycogen debranching enzyme (alpha-1,6-glucosidase) [Bacillus sp. UNCCL13]SFQ87732.1 Glycogen debranching enzyme (alpha-1,6-glucosidase) [Bacillus sp. cl95]
MDYRVIKENDLFLLTDSKGNISMNHPYGMGLYKKDTRFLSKLDVKINNEEPILLSSDANENYVAKILLTNPHMEKDGELILWRESVEIERKRFITEDILYETIKLKNYFPKAVSFDVTLEMEADFADMFIVRGFHNGKIGERTGQKVEGNGITFEYMGADDVYRATKISWNQNPKEVKEHGEITFHITLGHLEEHEITFTIQPQVGNEEIQIAADPKEAFELLKQSYENWENSITKVSTDYTPLQKLTDRGIGDLRVLLTDLGYGQFPVAGLPWFGVPFGRDSLIAAMQMLAFKPEIAKGTLRTMASHQGRSVNPWRDEQPGKIMHELRFGELANTNQIPFSPYYGTIDATPLFLVLLVEYVKWTGDFNIVDELHENIEAALKWIDQYGDRDSDLFVEYHQESSKGIANQGWKDSGDSIVHRNGEYAKTPIALSEVQGYVYQAKYGLADIFEVKGSLEAAEKLRNEAQKLKVKFEEEFWMEEQKFYAIALDQDKKQVGTITSNPGHVLFSGMLDANRVDDVTDMLISPKMFSGYGIRTMGANEAGYNPMSYHDGSIWPHDNSMILLGMSKQGKKEAANKVISGLIQSSFYFEYERLPELFCGYDSSIGKAVKYPVACSPQAWAAGTPLVFIQSLLGLFPNSLKKEITLSPVLLEEMNMLSVQDIKIGSGYLSVTISRTTSGLNVSIEKNTSGFKVVTN